MGGHTVRLERPHKRRNQNVREDTLDGLAVLLGLPSGVMSLDDVEFPTLVRKVIEVTGGGWSTLLGDGKFNVVHVIDLHDGSFFR